MLQELQNKIKEVKEETEHMGITHFKLPKMKKLQIMTMTHFLNSSQRSSSSSQNNCGGHP